MLQVRSSKLAKHSKYAPADGNRYDGIYKVSTVIQRTPLSRFDLGWKNNPTDKPVRWGSPLLRYYSSVNYLKLEYSTKSRFFCKKLFENLPLLLLHDLFNTFLPFFCFQSPSYAFLYWSSLISINMTEYHKFIKVNILFYRLWNTGPRRVNRDSLCGGTCYAEMTRYCAPVGWKFCSPCC